MVVESDGMIYGRHCRVPVAHFAGITPIHRIDVFCVCDYAKDEIKKDETRRNDEGRNWWQ